MKIFLSSDMEGTAGIVDWAQCMGDSAEAVAGRALLLAEVNAAIEGAVAGGATEIVVNDSHSTMRNLPPEQLAGGASYISGSHKPLYMMQGLDDSFDAVLFVSYHGSIGAPAGLSHTYNPRAVTEVRLEGVVTGEAGINALVAAHSACRSCLSPGTGCLRGDRGPPPGIHTAVVKERVAGRRAQPAPAPGLRADPRDRAACGRGRQPRRRRLGNAELEVAVRTTDIAEAMTWVRGVERTGRPGAAISRRLIRWPSTGRSPPRSC